MRVVRVNDMFLRSKVFVVALFICALVSGSAYAGENAGQLEGGHASPSNHLSVFVGNTNFEEEDGVSIGLDFEHRVCSFFGIGLLGEVVGGEIDSQIVGVPLFLHPYKGLQFLVAPAVEFEGGETKGLLRTGIGYQVHLEKGVTVTPQYNIDFIEGEDSVAQVFGVSIGTGF